MPALRKQFGLKSLWVRSWRRARIVTLAGFAGRVREAVLSSEFNLFPPNTLSEADFAEACGLDGRFGVTGDRRQGGDLAARGV